jgi:putative endonuclease
VGRISGLGAGRHAERIAANVLALRGYRILEWNRRERHDEIDLIAERDGWTVFVEVKLRRTTAFGGPVLAVDGVKRRRLLRGARAYLERSGRAGRPVRFDVIAILWSESEGRLTVDHLENAFAPSRWG